MTGNKLEVTKEKKNLELYIHIPFCVRKCRYCDFLSGPASENTQKEYVKALTNEINGIREEAEYSVSSIFIGGGTPSILEADLIVEIMKCLQEKFTIDDHAEITIETNPGTLTKEKLMKYRASGINRLSMGLQSPNGDELKMLGRIHDYSVFEENYRLARFCGFTNINVDLMFALPDQTPQKWEENLRKIAALHPEHISAYSLIIEEGTPFAAMELNLPSEDDEYQMYEDTAKILREYDYEQYEISNYAQKGYVCRHNDGYWTMQEYLGLGLGASSLYRGERFTNTTDLADYIEYSSSPEQIREHRQRLTRENQIEEFMFLGLRRTEGISKTQFQKCFGVPVEQYYRDVIRKYTEYALLKDENDRIFLTRKGIHVSNAVMAEFLL
ncbi:MAG: radical SAM family heme chaperone HemW [Eubacteriales bacterium]|nr:radical SAM family heme chaperone HemW [Eubacteriales bacterium]